MHILYYPCGFYLRMFDNSSMYMKAWNFIECSISYIRFISNPSYRSKVSQMYDVLQFCLLCNPFLYILTPFLAGESCVAFHSSDWCWRLQALMQLDLPQALLLCRTGSWGDIKWDASVKTIESWQTAKLKPICKNNWVLISAMLNRNFAYSSLWNSMMQDTAPFNV